MIYAINDGELKNQRIYIFVSMVIQIIGIIALFYQRKRMLQGKETDLKAYTVFIPLFVISTSFLIGLSNGSDNIRHFDWSDLTFINMIAILIGQYGYLRFKILFWLVLTYPIVSIAQIFSVRLQSSTILEKIKSRWMTYNVWYFFILSIITSIFVFVKTGTRTESINEGIWWIFWVLVLLLAFIYPLITFQKYYQSMSSKNKGLYKSVIWILCAYIVVTIIPISFEGFMENQIEKSQNIMREWGDNYGTYKKAHTLFLESAYRKQFNERWYTADDYFKKLFDATPEIYFWDKLKNIDLTSMGSAGTNASRIGKNADVILKLAEIENTITTSSGDIDIMKTVYKFHMTNKTTTNQEVIIYFQTPSQNSVISDLKLWLNWELQWTIASRWAAAQVYADSLRINRDPALIEKVWLNSYMLRIFPILSKTDQQTQGRQLVQFTILTPLQKDQIVTYAPQLSIINLKTNKETALISKIYKDNKLAYEDRVNNESIKEYLAKDHILPQDIVANIAPKRFADYCISTNWLSLDNKNWKLSNITTQTSYLDGDGLRQLFTGTTTEQGKISIFFDNSLSTERNKTNEEYKSIYDAIKNYGNKLQDIDIFSFNFAVEKLASIDDMKFRWYSDIDGILAYLEKNNITKQKIILVTDDDNFNFTTTENKDRNFSLLLSNQIDVIVIGNNIKTYKSDFNSMVAATQWNIHNISAWHTVSTTLQNILTTGNKVNFHLCGAWETMTQNIDIQKIIAWYLSNIMMGTVKNQDDWTRVANTQNYFAVLYQIVNQFNSMIALETNQQKQDLERYESRDNKFDTTYNNLWWWEEWVVGGVVGWWQEQADRWLLNDSFVDSNREVSTQKWTSPEELGNVFNEIDIAVNPIWWWYEYWSDQYIWNINANIGTILLIAIIYFTQIYLVWYMFFMIYVETKKTRTKKTIT